jgi:UDP-N-acetylmuramyl tripeptide synthase
MDEVEAPEPNHGFDDSRRLTGPNRWYAGTAVTLTPLGPAAHDAAAHARWAQRVAAMCAQLGWPAPQPRVLPHAREPMLMFAAPEDLLFTATEVNEWAWERSAAEAGITGYDLAQDLGDAPAAVFAARAAAERRPALVALREQAAAHALPVFVDDDEVSVGVGSGSRCWPLGALPAPADVPWAALHDAPTLLVTGSNGKTTTVRLLSAMAQAAGRAAGYCCTEGVFVDGAAVHRGDYSGPAGARTVLRHPGVDLAVLETARGGILRRGLAVQRAGVAVVTNIQPDHLGEYGIDSAADLAEVKLAVAHAVQHGGTLVLNGGDTVLMAAAQRLPHARAARQALFAAEFDHPALVAARAGGAATCGARGGRLLLVLAGAEHDLGDITDMPLTVSGAAVHNIENAAAAALAAASAGLPLAAVRDTLARFGARPQDNPGRLERWPYRGATVLVDYAHNPDGLAQLLKVARTLQPRRLGLLLGQAGNRDDAAIAELACTAAAAAPDRVLVKELPQMLRGRALGEVPALLQRTLAAAGLADERVSRHDDEEAAARALLAWAQPGDVVVLPVHTRSAREALALFLSTALSARG